MSDGIPFNRALDLKPGKVDEVAPGIRRLLAPNPGPFTFTGTVSYIVGRGKVAIIDPGPQDEAHISALLDAVRDETVSHILVTHTHRDHSPAAAAIKAATGALLYGEGPHRPSRTLHVGESPRLDSGGDQAFHPDVRLNEGDLITGKGWALESVATPGHTANHLAFGLQGSDILFSGDHVMGWSTTIVAPPDGSMQDYMRSLFKLQGRAEATYLPGHGPVIRDAPVYVQHLIQHREGREAAVLRQLSQGEADIPTLVREIYVGLDPRLIGAAGLSVLAHLEDLTTRGLVATDGEPRIDSRYRVAAG
jgi:glyoxylase-like metal-dependent hydrolase (beta-lactamase superfamily II)